MYDIILKIIAIAGTVALIVLLLYLLIILGYMLYNEMKGWLDGSITNDSINRLDNINIINDSNDNF